MPYRIGFPFLHQHEETSPMGRLKNVELWDSWRDRLRRFEGSSLSVRDFCDWEDVSQAAFYLWRKKLRGGIEPERRPQEVRSRKQRPLFVPVVSAASSPSRPDCESDVTSGIVVMILTDGTRVEMPADDHRLVARVVKSVAGLRGGDQ